LLACCVMISYTTHALTGFGGIIIAVTLASHLYPIGMLLPILVPLDILVNSYIVARRHAHIDRSILFREIVPFMLIGLVIGIAIFSYTRAAELQKVFGLFVLFLSVRELYRLLKNTPTVGLSRVTSTGYMIAAGVVQGVYASGGPLLVYAVSGFNLPKSVFRSTLSALWLITNIMLVTSYSVTGKVTWESVEYFLILLPIVIGAIITGEKLHGLVNERVFKIVVFLILIVAGLSIVIL